MPADPFTLRQADQARTDFAIIEDELEAIHKRLSQLPTQNEVWRAALLVKDHVVPLACGGPDAVSNLQWQTTAASKAKDRWETKSCPR